MNIKKLKVNGYAIQKGRTSIPILQSVHVIIKNGKLSVISTDNKVVVRVRDTTTLPDDDFLVPYAVLSKILKAGSEVSRKGDKLVVDKIQIATSGSDDYPEIPSVKGKSFTLDQETLLTQLQQVYRAAALDNFEPVFNSVCIDISNKKYTLIATDSRRLSHIPGGSCECDAAVQLIVPLKVISILLKTLTMGKVKVTFFQNETTGQIQFSLGKDIDIISRLIDGVYPAGRQVIPKAYDYTIEVPTDVFTESIKSAVAILPKKTKWGVASPRIILSNVANGISISAKNVETDITYSIVLPAKIQGGFEFGINGGFVLDALSASPKVEIVTIKGNEPLSPVVINGNHIIMPIKVSTSADEE